MLFLSEKGPFLFLAMEVPGTPQRGFNGPYLLLQAFLVFKQTMQGRGLHSLQRPPILSFLPQLC